MHDMTSGWWFLRKLAPQAAGAAIVLLWAMVVCGQNAAPRSKTPGTYPRLPGAVTKAPSWIGRDAPFDVAKYFEPVPRDRNAAPLYLDALFEFGAEVEVCFPEGPDRSRRSQTAKDRAKRFNDLLQPAYNDPKFELDPAAVDQVIALYDTGYRKLAQAQRLPLCVFESGLGITALLPHAQASRSVARVSSLRVQRAVQRGDMATAIREVDMVLRLVRDLRPRGYMISQLVADAISQVICFSAIPSIVASPRLRAEHCERLIKVLSGHEEKSIDGYVEGLRSEYLVTRTILDDLAHHQSELAKALGLKPGDSVVRAITVGAGQGNAPGTGTPSEAQTRDWDAQVARSSPAELARRVKEVDRFYRSLLELSAVPYAGRIERILAIKPSTGSDPLSLALSNAMQPASMESVARAEARTFASLRAMECLLVLRRYKLSHKGSPKDLASIVQGAGLKSVPADPYDGKPYKMATVNGELLVYSVGRDGKDDGGLIDCDRDIKPTGDLIYRMPAIEQNHVLKP